MAEALFFSSAATSTLPLFHGGRKSGGDLLFCFRWNLFPSSFYYSSASSSSTLCLSYVKTPTKRLSHAASTSSRRSGKKTRIASEGTEEDATRLICPGCGVFMQNNDPDRPGFYQKRANAGQQDEDDSVDLLSDSDCLLEEDDEGFDGSSSKFDLGSETGGFSEVEEKVEDGTIGWDSDWEFEEDEEIKRNKELDGFSLPGVGYGNITEETLKEMKRERISKAEKKRRMREAMRNEADNSITVCARCHSLRNYGQIKNQKAENLIPDFDFNRFISTRLMKPSNNAPVVLMVVDCVDFDGSFPKRAAMSLFKALEASQNSLKITKLPRLVLVATKVDLLPQQISPARLDQWVRRRAKQAGAPKLNAVYLVSARKDLGVRNLLSFIKDLAGPRGHVWVIGARNAGKSTLINVFAKNEGVRVTRLTEAAVPGTTLGILRITGILPAKVKLYDTPGLLHPYLVTMRLNREEQKMVEIRKELKPRTYRMKVGQTVHVGGLMRLDLTQCSTETIYNTVWSSPNVSLHLGKIENALEMRSKHFGIRLQPPIGENRTAELDEWKPTEFKISGNSWDVNSVDLSVAGLGWFSLGLKCEATIVLWTFKGIEVTVREPLVLDRAPFLERPGFLLPKNVTEAIVELNKMVPEAREKNVGKKLNLEASI
ncbi:NO-associated protein 1, chloroplastic/mitochondrial [Apostasia shenzhenica]|uniref:NO-associated protein 1, chloroplastic/mitochondrial n=1 Tax=Apostasia shenzhenica TaxID=1088818 RepID=A0A2I0A0A3_9ASPA|nr:NO-associated protein 1, chloroplastic/mitochondrial [Apostasia shenzhenica]